jgi:hypothetical protein
MPGDSGEKLMGTDLCQYGSHTINFRNRNREEIAEEIKQKLDSFHLVNEEHLKLLVIAWESSYLDDPQALQDKALQTIKEKKTRKVWKWRYSISDEYKYESIKFYGFLNFGLDFSSDKIYFREPPYRYFGWFYMDKEIRDEWRKYTYQTIHLFGGNRAIYLPSNMMDAEKYLDDYDSIDSPFEEIERDLIKEYGPIKKKLGEFKKYDDDDDIPYYLDDYSDLSMEPCMPLEDYEKYLNDMMTTKEQ